MRLHCVEWNHDNNADLYPKSKLINSDKRDTIKHTRATIGTEKTVTCNQNHNQTVTEPSGEPDKIPNLHRRDLIIELVTLTQDLGRVPSDEEIDEFGEFTFDQFEHEFGDIFHAFQESGIIPDSVTRSEFYTAIGKESNESSMESDSKSVQTVRNQRQVKTQEIHASPQSGTSTENFDKINPSKITVERPEKTDLDEYDQANLISEIQRFADILGEPPREELVDAYGTFPTEAYENKFGSWNDSLEAAGIDPDNFPDWNRRTYTNVEILDSIRSIADRLGRPPTTTETEKHVDFSAGLGTIRFGSWEMTLELAGLNPEERSSVRRPDTEIGEEGKKEHVDEDEVKKHDDETIGSAIDDVLEHILSSREQEPI